MDINNLNEDTAHQITAHRAQRLHEAIQSSDIAKVVRDKLMQGFLQDPDIYPFPVMLVRGRPWIDSEPEFYFVRVKEAPAQILRIVLKCMRFISPDVAVMAFQRELSEDDMRYFGCPKHIITCTFLIDVGCGGAFTANAYLPLSMQKRQVGQYVWHNVRWDAQIEREIKHATNGFDTGDIKFRP